MPISARSVSHGHIGRWRLTAAILFGWACLFGLSRVPLAAGSTPLPRIQCPTGYSATIYAEGLQAPDGLAFSPAGELYVAEEGSAKRVSRITAGGIVEPVLSGISSPEGIAFDRAGNLYVVEDIQNGRLLRRSPDGTLAVLASELDAPEGVVWAPDGTIYVTESNVEFAGSPRNYRTQVRSVTGAGVTVITGSIRAFLWSYAGITRGGDGLLYITNEASGTGTQDSIFTLDPATGISQVFARNLVSPEGLRFSPGGAFPLYVVEEDTGSGGGRLSSVAADGSSSMLCTGFLQIEDVALDAAGNLYISEDSSGLVIRIAVPPGGSPTQTPTSTSTSTATATATVTASPTMTPTATGGKQSRLHLPLIVN